MSKKVYCLAHFRAKEGKEQELFEVLKSLEPDTLREDGCIQYIVTRRVQSEFATGDSYPILFNEVWADMESFEAHCRRKAIVDFFERECLSEDGIVDAYNVCLYSDEPENYDAPVKG